MSVASRPFLPQEVIRRKRDGETLDQRDLKQFVDGTVSGAVSQAQIGAFTMAVYLNGMSRQERIDYTLAMRDSGRVIDWATVGLEGPTIIDKHSSGGVGDEKVSLIVAPLVAACGIRMPMISARGLGHTGGEIDLLEAIPGYDTVPTTAAFMNIVKDIGCAIIAPTPDLAPADKPIFYARDVCATVESIPLITGSIMSKKLAAGINGLVMTVPFGSGAFMKTEARAVELAEGLLDVARGAGVPMTALISDLTQVLGDSVGSGLQIREVVRFLTGEYREPRLLEAVLALVSETLVMGGLAGNLETARGIAWQHLEDGSAKDRFARMVLAFGGPADLVDLPERYIRDAPVIRPVYLEKTGFVSQMDCYAIGIALLGIGAGRTRPQDDIDHTVGASSFASVGSTMDATHPFCILHAPSEDAWERCSEALTAAVECSVTPAEPLPVIRSRLSTD
ncbi:thymidine phosphorylase [Rhizobium sp. PP-F2F-G36]|nr:thymidine phosphorylase [Rhizobium sp. PP-F2F-G36]